MPFPLLRQETAGLPQPLFVFGTASLLGINSASPVADDAALVLDALFTQDVRRSFSAALPGDWNIPLADADAAALRAVSPSVFADSAVGLTEVVRDGRYGYATWSFFPPRAEALVVSQVRDVVEGRVTVRQHLAELDATFAEERATVLIPGLL
ncbi:hypothetical protein [Streptomyces sp. NPDC050982]|uniref:hypothetical protein n=1 Tax=Streptomyces sp. NPDC050982 TaxID=3154746 RepID=UPI0033C1152B